MQKTRGNKIVKIIFCSFLSQRIQIILRIKHTVYVRRSKKQKKKKRILRQRMNLWQLQNRKDI